MREKKFKEREIESYTRSVYDIRKCLVLQNYDRPLVIEANKKEMILKKDFKIKKPRPLKV